MRSHLKRGLIKSCGCIKGEKKIPNLVGKTFGRLTVIEIGPRTSVKKGTYYLCRCECGNLKEIKAQALVSGATLSCGCYNKEVMTTHGMSKTKLYDTLHKMKRRCNNIDDKNYKNYGGRGIKICEDWEQDFIHFYNWSILSGYKEGLTIDRIDNDGPYSPENCRWVSQKVQAGNKRNNHMLTLNGKTQCLAAWCEELNMRSSTIINRLNLGWSEEKALTYPLKPNGKRKVL
jgi:hypothetical protein